MSSSTKTFALISLASALCVGLTIWLGFIWFPAENNGALLEMNGFIASCLAHHPTSYTNKISDGWLNCNVVLHKYYLHEAFNIRAVAIELFTALAILTAMISYFLYDDERLLPRHLRGRRLYRGKAALRAFNRALKKEVKRAGSLVSIIPGVPLPITSETTPTIGIGQSKSGKTVHMMNQLQQYISLGQKVIALDVKGDLISKLSDKNGDIPALIRVGDERSAHWVLGWDILDENDAHEIAAFLIKDAEKNKFFSDTARMIVVAIILDLIASKGTAWSWGHLYRSMIKPIEELQNIATKNYPPASSALANNGGETANNVVATLLVAAKIVRTLSIAWSGSKQKISIRRWLKAKNPKSPIILLGWRADNRETSGAWMGAFIDLIGKIIASPQTPESQNKTLNLILDEFAELPKMQGLITALNIGRSRGLSASIYLQNVGQLRTTYSRDVADGILSNVGTQLIFKQNAGPEADAMSKHIGEAVTREYQTSKSTNGRGPSVTSKWVEVSRPVITPDELCNKLGPKEDGVDFILMGQGPDVYTFRSPYVDMPKIRESFIPIKHTTPKPNKPNVSSPIDMPAKQPLQNFNAAKLRRLAELSRQPK